MGTVEFQLCKSMQEICNQANMLSMDIERGNSVDFAMARLAAIEAYLMMAADLLTRCPSAQPSGVGAGYLAC